MPRRSGRLLNIEIRPQGQITSVQTYLKPVFDVREHNDNQKFMYRGVTDANKHVLIPSIGRTQPYADKERVFDKADERDLLHRFRRRAYPHFDRVVTAGEAIFIARHYGLPTRLLDWTNNAVFAIYFACCNEWGCPGRVWAMLPLHGSLRDEDVFRIAERKTEPKLFRLFDDPAIKIIYPLYNSPRIVSQDGAFTWHSNPWVSIESLDGQKIFPKKNLDFRKLYHWEIPYERKPDIVRELSGLGITKRALFPGLDGIAQSLWETAVLWSRPMP